MFEYHGWLSTFESLNENEVESVLRDMNGSYPVSVQSVNGKLHISFSGNPNRDSGEVRDIVKYMCGLKAKLSGCVYINDPDSERFNQFDVIKIVEDIATEIEDKNFSIEETKQLFE